MNLVEDISKKLEEYVRILKLAKRPKREEFFKISKIAGAAMALVGIIGFSELQSLAYLVCRLLLEKQNKRKTITLRSIQTDK